MVTCVFVSNSPRNVASKRSLLLILVLRGHSRGTVCQMPLTPLKVKWSLCLMTLSLAASILPQLAVFFFPFAFTIFTSSYLHQMAHHSRLPSLAPYISPLPQSLTVLFAHSKDKKHTMKSKGGLHEHCVKLTLFLPGDSQWQLPARENDSH